MNSSQIKFAANLIGGGKDSIMQAVALSGGYRNKIQPGQQKLILRRNEETCVAVWWAGGAWEAAILEKCWVERCGTNQKTGCKLAYSVARQ